MDDKKLKNKKIKFSIGYVIAAVLILTLIRSLVIGPGLGGETEISYSEFKTALKASQVVSVTVCWRPFAMPM